MKLPLARGGTEDADQHQSSRHHREVRNSRDRERGLAERRAEFVALDQQQP